MPEAEAAEEGTSSWPGTKSEERPRSGKGFGGIFGDKADKCTVWLRGKCLKRLRNL